MSHKFQNLADPNSTEPGRNICTMAFDVLKISSKNYVDHVRQVNIVLESADECGGEFAIKKSAFAGEAVEYWGFILSSWPPAYS